MSHQLWKLANGAAVLVGSCASPEGLAPVESALLRDIASRFGISTSQAHRLTQGAS